VAALNPADEGADSGIPVTPGTLVMVGGGDHAAVVVDAALSRPGTWQVVGYLAPDPSDRLAAMDPAIRHLGADEAWTSTPVDLLSGTLAPSLILGFGGGIRPGDRERTVERFAPTTRWATVIHASATVSAFATVGDGVLVGPQAVVGPGASLGDHVIVNSGAIVEHDVIVGAYSHLAPGAVIGGGTRVGRGAFIGLGARVRDHVTVGDRAVVAMGATVVGNVDAERMVLGMPAAEADERHG
jgi:acetyltransferase EpsM